MAKLGLLRHRLTVSTLCFFYVIICTLTHIYCLIDTFSGSLFVISLINLAIGFFGLYSLTKENGTLMKIYGIILVIEVVLQVLLLLGILTTILLRETVLNEFLKELMNKYYESTDEREAMDGIQRKFECCGRQSYQDWTMQPFSCCATSDCSTYFADGCVVALSSFVSYILLIFGLTAVVSIIVHIYAVVSAFELARVYRQGPIQPSIKHGFTNF